MAEVAELVGNLFKTNILPTSPEIVLPSQRQLRQLPLVEVMAVDPANPHEVDDAFAVTRRSSRPLEVSIVIARGGLIPYTSPEFAEALANGWSLYPEPGLYIPMIDKPELVAHDLSLVEGELRPGIELSFELTREGLTRQHRIRAVAAKTTQKTYEQLGHELLQGEHLTILHAVDAIRRFRSGNTTRLNPHAVVAKYMEHSPEFAPREMLARKLVQELMVQGNKEFGRHAKRNQGPFLYRHTKVVFGSGEDTEGVMRAFYSPHPNRHDMLGTKRYTHTTSPLRRAADLLNHQLLEFELAGGSPQDINRKSLTKLTQHINDLIMSRSVRIGREF